jgi:hypothetical protein
MIAWYRTWKLEKCLNAFWIFKRQKNGYGSFCSKAGSQPAPLEALTTYLRVNKPEES